MAKGIYNGGYIDSTEEGNDVITEPEAGSASRRCLFKFPIKIVHRIWLREKLLYQDYNDEFSFLNHLPEG